MTSQLAHEPGTALHPVELAVGQLGLAEGVGHGGDGQVVRVGVLADVHRREVDAHRADRADDGGQLAPGDELAVVHRERPAQQLEVGDQRLRAEVVGARLVLTRRAGREAGAGAGQLDPDARDLEPVGLLGVDPPEAGIDLGEALEVLVQGGQELVRHTADA